MTALLLAALQMAYERRRPPGLLHHSDGGSQYASRTYRLALDHMAMTCSMSRKGDCWDNAVVESFFANLEREEVAETIHATRQGDWSAMFTYLEVFYNRERRHSSLAYLSPAEFEQSSRAAELPVHPSGSTPCTALACTSDRPSRNSTARADCVPESRPITKRDVVIFGPFSFGSLLHEDGRLVIFCDLGIEDCPSPLAR